MGDLLGKGGIEMPPIRVGDGRISGREGSIQVKSTQLYSEVCSHRYGRLGVPQLAFDPLHTVPHPQNRALPFMLTVVILKRMELYLVA